MSYISTFRYWLLAVGMVLLGTGCLFAQGTDLGTIRGAILDPSGAVIPRAAVEVIDMGTNQTRRLQSSAEGLYEASALKSGAYLLRAGAEGFNTTEMRGIALKGGDVLRVDLKLTVKAAGEAVTVEATAPLVNMENPTLSAELGTRALLDIPRDSRDIYSFLYLNPNVTQSADGDNFKFLGAQSYGASFSLDGQRSNGGIFGQPTQSQPSLETIGELTVLSNNFSAEYAGIANIRVTTKRGEGQYHGSLFYNNRNSALAAWALRDKVELSSFVPSPERPDFKKPYFNLNEVGASLGGPVAKLRNTYFMMGYEKRLQAQPVLFQSTRMPHASLWKGDFSKVNDSIKPAVPAGITLTPTEVANDTVGGMGQKFVRIPPRLLNPTVQKFVQSYFPLASVGMPIDTTNGRMRFYQQIPGSLTRDLGTLRLDHDFTDNDRFYTVFNIQSADQQTSAVNDPFPGMGLSQAARQNYTVSSSYTKLIRPTLINEFRGGFNIQYLFQHSNFTVRQFLSSIGFDESDITAYGQVIGPELLDTYGHPSITWQKNAFQTFGTGGRNTYRPLDQKLTTFGDTLSWIHGSHSIRAGADLVRNQALDGFANNRGTPRGQINYTGGATNAFTQWLLGMPPTTATAVIALRPPMDVHNWETGFFVQDDWKLTPRLTLNLGLRYELITPFVEANDLMVNFDPNAPGASKDHPGQFIVPSEKTLKRVDPRLLSYGYKLARDAGVGRGLVKTDTNNFAPRVGLAYRVNDNLALRGGYGIFYPTSAAQGMRDALATNPFNQTITLSSTANAQLSGWPGFQHGFSPLTGGTTVLKGGNLPSFNMIPLDLRSPRIHQFNGTVEYQLLPSTAVRASYLGTRMRGLIAGRDLNMIPPSDNPLGVTTGDGVTICNPDDGDCDFSAADMARLPFPTLGDWMASYGNMGDGRSDALQLEVNRRYSKGFTFNAVYTRLEQNSAVLDTGNSSLGGATYNPFKPMEDYGRDAFVSRHRLVAYGIWEIPFGRGRALGNGLNPIADAAAGGWDMSFNLFAKSGTAFTPYMLCDNCGPLPGNIYSSAVDALGDFSQYLSFRPTIIGDVQGSGDRQWSPAAFGPPSVGADLFSNPKNAKRGALGGPSTMGLNLGVRKNFRFGERIKAELGADFDNILNHPLLSPNTWDIGYVGDFSVDLDPVTGKLLPITRLTPNADFGRKINSFSQDGIDSRRAVRLRLRISF